MTKASDSLSGLDQAPERQHDALDVGLALDAVGPLGEGLADDLRPALEGERLQRVGEAARHGLVRVRVDDEDAGHGRFSAADPLKRRRRRCPVLLPRAVIPAAAERSAGIHRRRRRYGSNPRGVLM